MMEDTLRGIMRTLVSVFLAVFFLGLSPAAAQPGAPQSQALSASDLQKITQAAEAGDAAAQAHLGTIYVLDTDVPQNYGYAYFWLTLAAMNGDREFEPIRHDVARLLTPAAV